MAQNLLNTKKLYSKRIDEALEKIQIGLAKPRSQTIYNVLHIDDSESVLQISKMFLEGMDHSICISTETNTECVIDHIQKGVDCFIVDYSMPDIDGVELSKMIRRFTDKPIILFTSKDCSEVPLSEMYEMNIDYLQKKGDPCIYHLLSQMVRRLVNQNNLSQSLVSSLELVVRSRM